MGRCKSKELKRMKFAHAGENQEEINNEPNQEKKGKREKKE